MFVLESTRWPNKHVLKYSLPVTKIRASVTQLTYFPDYELLIVFNRVYYDVFRTSSHHIFSKLPSVTPLSYHRHACTNIDIRLSDNRDILTPPPPPHHHHNYRKTFCNLCNSLRLPWARPLLSGAEESH